jgi:hypothetical protein
MQSARESKPDPTDPDPTDPDPTDPDPTGSDPTGSDPTDPDPTGWDRTGWDQRCGVQWPTRPNRRLAAATSAAAKVSGVVDEVSRRPAGN